MDENQRICLVRSQVEYDTINGVARVVAMRPVEQGFYRIGAAIVHTGNLEQGHYQCMERAANGTLIKHNDSICELNPTEDLSRMGYFVRLDLEGFTP